MSLKTLANGPDSRCIRVRGARENNLQGVSLDIPRHALTVFSGVSGSGKSSLVFDTIGAEAQRQLNETFSAFQQSRLPRYGQPSVESVENLSTPIIISQRRIGGNARSTVGTVTDIYALLRLLFSRAGQPHVGYSNAFSFNDPEGMCGACDGLGKQRQVDVDKLIDRERSLDEGPFRHVAFAHGSWFWKIFKLSGRFDSQRKLKDYSAEEWQDLLRGKAGKIKLKIGDGAINSQYEGILDKFERLYVKRDTAEMAESTRENADAFMSIRTCPECNGKRLKAAVLECRIDGRNIAELCALEASELVKVLATIDGPVARPLAAKVEERVRELVAIGLGYLSLDRETASLSGGESQRIKMVRHLSSSLIEVLYILDEPSIGLHPRDVYRLISMLWKLRDKGNTVLVVEHDREVIAAADHVVDMGPAAGVHGGRVVFEGTPEQLHNADSRTGAALRERPRPKASFREASGQLRIEHANLHNLKDVSVSIPRGVLTVVTGVAGSGKSSLVNGAFLAAHPGVVVIDQAAVGASSRSTAVTYLGVMDEIRDSFARAHGVSASLFSFNSKGACPECKGLGVTYTELAFMDPIKAPCTTCQGRRFTEKVLSYRLRGKSIFDVLSLDVTEALAHFEGSTIAERLRPLHEVGLSYIALGQALSTLSGGECQRLKLATELGKRGSIYVMDEPTTGLHMTDIAPLLSIINRLVDARNTVVVIEHNLDIVKHADWIIDLGPEGGSGGGRVVFEGTPADMLKSGKTLTAECLRAHTASVLC
jgi:excinuclease UvrABC ATPase subunit